MNNIVLILAWACAPFFTNWQPDFETAKKLAREKNQLILLNFSGSDWCGPCIRLKKEVFETETFNTMADNSLVLLNADFPRNKKNQLPKPKQQHNDALAEKYNPQGKFPYTLVLDADGKTIRAWEGFPSQGAEAFIAELKTLSDAHRH